MLLLYTTYVLDVLYFTKKIKRGSLTTSLDIIYFF
nr:MAG TPA: hypothetical protein [Caudoviricetes sp.]